MTNKNVSKREPVMTIQEVAGYLKLSERTVYEMARQGKMPGIKLGPDGTSGYL